MGEPVELVQTPQPDKVNVVAIHKKEGRIVRFIIVMALFKKIKP